MPILTRKRFRLELPKHSLELGSRTLIMGVLNVTPDSFSDGGAFLNPSRAADRAWQMAEEGADILDIGGESTRPGSRPVPADEELKRVLPVLERLSDKYPLPISVDTSKSEVARVALGLGAVIVNDVTALGCDPFMAGEVAAAGAGLVLMNMRGTPLTMQKIPPSPDILREIEQWAEEAVARARNGGVSSEKLILDPGIGFGKTVGQNLEILRSLDRLAAAGFPLLIGASRKSFIGEVLRDPQADRVWGTAASVAASVVLGAHIVRVHDVAPMRDVVRMADAIAGTAPVE